MDEYWSLRARIAELEEALEPFARAAGFFDTHRTRLTDDDVLLHHESVGAEAKITLADLRRARATHKKAVTNEVSVQPKV